jgi:hypothetical protein
MRNEKERAALHYRSDKEMLPYFPYWKRQKNHSVYQVNQHLIDFISPNKEFGL